MQELILVVDDEPRIVKLTRDYLEKDGYRVIHAGDGDTALAMARREKPDLIVLDIMLPGMDGWEVCRLLRRESDVPVIMLTARVEESDQIVGLELGADDYITKPFSPRTLVARVRAVLRRAQGRLKLPQVVRSGRLLVDLAAHRVTLEGKDLHLTPTEFKLLAVLAQRPGQIFTRENLLDQMNNVAVDSFDRSIDSHIKNLRRKLESDPEGPRFIETVYGVGYRFLEQEP
ncbi:MAG: response regulator transcription factor [Chloroflexi bacterium]|jgi:DNA-binding response OmpR family regulator|nr:response regulator transcription factor [Chloroflexota bacterium]